MKTLATLALLVLLAATCKGQIYVDPAVAAATGVHAGVMNSQLNNVTDKLTLIQRGQLAVTGQLVIINDLQSKIYKGLSEVSGAVRSLLSVKEIAQITLDISSNLTKAMDLAKTNPALLLFAEAGAREFKTRATALASEVSSMALKGGKQNLMDAGERAKMLSRIHQELTILRGVSYGMHRSMFWAQQRGILNSLNPYSGFINIDKKIAEQVIRNSKLLNR